MARKAKKRSWLVYMDCTIRKEVVCDDCTEEQARNDTWDYAVDERELDCMDYDVTEVRPND